METDRRCKALIGAVGGGTLVLALALTLGLSGTSSASGGRPAHDSHGIALPAPIYGLAGARRDRPDPSSRPSRTRGAASLPTGRWISLGPSPIGPPFLQGGNSDGGPNSGRITSLAYLPSGLSPGRVVAGAAGGGIWTSDNSGATWTPRTDAAPDLAIGAIAVDPSNPNHLIAGTGEANQCGDCYAGDGILVSTNAGTSWALQNPAGVFTNLHIAQVAIDPSNPSHEFAATDGGLYVTSNGGTSWAKPTDPSYAAVDGNITSVVIDPAAPSTVFIGGGAATVAESTDGGVTWKAANSGIAASGPYPFIALAIAPSSPSVMYAAVGSENPVALYKSTTGGASWSKLTGAPDYTGQAYSYGSGTAEQGWYDNVVAVDPSNPNHVLAGGIAMVETTNGGSTWTNVNGSPFFGGTNPLHPDQHALAFASDGSVWMGDDGGVYHYTPSTGAVANANGNLDVTQFYYGFNVVGLTLLAGSQDNASARAAISGKTTWTGIWGGDGGPSAITPNHTATQFIEADGNLYITTDAFATTLTDITPPSSTGSLFTPPTLVVPNTTTPADPTVFYGGVSLYRTTNPNPTPTWTPVASVAGSYVSALAVSPTNSQVVYVGFTNGTIEVSTDGGVSFAPLAAASSPQKFVTGLSVDPSNPKAITASFSYSDTRYVDGLPHVQQYLWGSAPGTGTWTDITGTGLPSAVSRVVYDGGVLVAATDSGVYGTTAPAGTSTSWSKVGTGLPSVQVQDLFVNSTGVYAITHGRGAWLLPAPADLAVAVSGPASFPKGANGSYTVTVTNNGPATAYYSSLSDAVPAGTTFVSEAQNSGPTFTCTNPAVGATGTTVCKATTLAPGATATFTLTYALPASTTQTSVSDSATISSTVNPDPTPANNQSTVVTPVS